jgi:hypothetical protein
MDTLLAFVGGEGAGLDMGGYSFEGHPLKQTHVCLTLETPYVYQLRNKVISKQV